MKECCNKLKAKIVDFQKNSSECLNIIGEIQKELNL